MLKAFDLWGLSYLRQRTPQAAVTDVLLCVCDHFEPRHQTTPAGAQARVQRWRAEYPALTQPFRDSGGGAPRHTFFFPVEQYEPHLLDELSALCRATGSELEIHLHHQGDTEASLRATLEQAVARLRAHGALCRDPQGTVRYGFIHGNWALANSHPHGGHCGVDDELRILRETGCYADFTMPSAPHRAQTRKVNSLYYAESTGRKAHDTGLDVTVADSALARLAHSPRHLLVVQGPLGLNWQRRKWGVLPRLENGDLTGANPPTPLRLKQWLQAGVHVHGRPEWRFIKLHTHGAPERNAAMLLGLPMQEFHKYFTHDFPQQTGTRVHYVTARELVNILHAAEAGHGGNAGDFRNFYYQPPI